MAMKLGFLIVLLMYFIINLLLHCKKNKIKYTFGKLLLYDKYGGDVLDSLILHIRKFVSWHVSSSLQELEIKFHHVSSCSSLVFS